MAKRLAIIGGGTGGYVAAIRAAQLGAEVTVIEKDRLGGTCLNRGCTPTKALLHASGIYREMMEVSSFGVHVKEAAIDINEMQLYRQMVTERLLRGVESLMRKNKIKCIQGAAGLVDPKTVEIIGKKERIVADNIIIATGSEPQQISLSGLGPSDFITSNEALGLKTIPRSTVIIGGGVIGVEFAQILNRLGSQVSIIEIMPHILPAEDEEATGVLDAILREQGIQICTKSAVTKIKAGESKEVFFTTNGESNRLAAECVMLAAGRRPYTDELGAEKLGLFLDKGRVAVNEHMETNIAGIYAVGDVTGGYMLAHVAMEQGKCAAENIFGFHRKIDYGAVPRCIYTSPEFAAVGLTEEQAKMKYGEIKTGRFPLAANAKALIGNQPAGMVKLIGDAKYGQLLGACIIGPHATEMIAEAVLALRLEATMEDIASTIHAHPTLSESMMEAALNFAQEAIHI